MSEDCTGTRQEQDMKMNQTVRDEKRPFPIRKFRILGAVCAVLGPLLIALSIPDLQKAAQHFSYASELGLHNASVDAIFAKLRTDSLIAIAGGCLCTVAGIFALTYRGGGINGASKKEGVK